MISNCQTNVTDKIASKFTLFLKYFACLRIQPYPKLFFHVLLFGVLWHKNSHWIYTTVETNNSSSNLVNQKQLNVAGTGQILNTQC